ncbi:hypothetical protein FB446DRAFT_734134 [Lentinula raphanica]|nr:hypothetical protein FB446DRAFT_734134 [Lentinula raphanica]
MHLLSSSLWTSLVLCSIVRSAGSTPVPADQRFPAQIKQEDSHLFQSAGSPQINQLSRVKTLPANVDYAMKIETGSEAVKPLTRISFIELGKKILDHWGEHPNPRIIDIWPNDIAEHDNDFKDLRLFEYFTLEASLAKRESSPHCPDYKPCIGRLRKSDTSIEYAVESPATGKTDTFELDTQILVIGLERVPRSLKLLLGDAWSAALSHWAGKPLRKDPNVVNEDATYDEHHDLWRKGFELEIVGSVYCLPNYPCSGKYNNFRWTITSPNSGTVVLGGNGNVPDKVLGMSLPPLRPL